MVEEVIVDLRSAVEKNLHKAITETSRLDTRINDITKIAMSYHRKWWNVKACASTLAD